MVGALLLAACGPSSGVVAPEEQAEDYKIVGYVMGRRSLDLRRIDATKLTHINYAFANIADGKVVLEGEHDPANFATLNALKADNPRLKILLSVGGWSWSDHFSDAALTEASRETFARSAVDLLITHALDGIDLDWEYPGQLGEDNVYRPEDKQNFTSMLKAVREKLDAQSEKDGRSDSNRYLLTIASGANQTYLDHTEMANAHHYLDYVNIMTYDYFTGGSSTTGHHTNLFKSATNVPHQSSAQAVQEHLDAGIPARKLVLGAAFYGRGWKVEDPDQMLYGAPSESGFSAPYYKIVDLIKNDGYTRQWDASAKAPYLWQPDSSIVLTYDDPESLTLKCDYLKSKGLAGIMFWEYSHDFEGELLESIYSNLTK